eukprot:COSAG06_NODE_9682_length_1845_cov_2.424971_3_plen_88_part_01
MPLPTLPCCCRLAAAALLLLLLALLALPLTLVWCGAALLQVLGPLPHVMPRCHGFDCNPGKKNVGLFEPFIYENVSFYQDRLGTDIGK